MNPLSSFFLTTGLIMTLNLTSAVSHAGYCAAIRGNGELMPAHWGAMSSIVEEKGLPSAMAGGSSASITIFLLESLALSPLPKNTSEQALLIKSFQGYFEALSQTPEGLALQSLFADQEAFKRIITMAPSLSAALKSPEGLSLLTKHLADLQTLTQGKTLNGLINPEFVLYVAKTLELTQRENPSLSNVIHYRTGQIVYALKNFGKFDAEKDRTLFFSPRPDSFQKGCRAYRRDG